MTTLTPCWTDSEENRFPADELEDTDPRTAMEKRLEWLCEEWTDAIVDDNFDAWHDLRMAIHGASQTLIHCKDRHDDSSALFTLAQVAFEHSMTCISEGKYEGSPK